ncbi:MAG TPA: DUF5596 domain-containing protein [Candidatus Fimivicinus intestinavium]|nr:DUF5596 domain-containing protein [Candidatus Fimivicinus intestinavium]
MNTAFLMDLCEKIELPQEDRELAFQEMKKHPARIEAHAKRMYRQNDVVRLEMLLRLNRRKYAPLVLAVLLCAAEYTYAGYQEHGIPERYYYDMMQDITHWTENGRVEFGVPGFSEISWAKNYITMNLFQLGRLQFQFSRVDLSGKLGQQELAALPIPNEANVLYIHIPKGAPLDREACLDSIRQAKAFFPRYYPEFDFQGFYTSSWLLDPRLKQLLPSGSRILQFQKLFDRVYTREDHSRAAIRFLWYRHDRNFAAFPEQTSLQRSVKQYLLNGGALGETCGMIPLSQEFKTE